MKLAEWKARERPQYRPKADALCKACMRKHNKKDVCALFLRTRTDKNGEEYKIWGT